MGGRRNGREAVEAALAQHLAESPDAVLCAADHEGFVVPWPETLPHGGHALFRADHALELVALDDVPTLLGGWDTTWAEGIGSVDVSLADGTRAHVTAYDVREVHGVVAVVVTSADGPVDPDVRVDTEHVKVRPRICRVRKNESACIVDADTAVTGMLGWPLEELQGQRQIDFVHPDDAPAMIDMWIRLLSHPGIPQHLRARHRQRDGSYLWVELINQNRLRDPAHRDVACDMIDISEQVAAEQALVAREDLLTRLMESLPSGIAHVDGEGQVLSANDRLFELLSVEPTRSIEDLLAPVVPTDRAPLRAAVDLACRDKRPGELEASVLADDGGHRVCQFVLRGLVDSDETTAHAVLSVTDVTDTVMARDQLVRQATTDPLTQCQNRASVMGELARRVAEATPGHGVAVVFVDLDRFKDVNDELGHAAGDELLQLVAERLRGGSRDHDVVGRLGGDEFLVVCPNVKTRVVADQLARRLHDVVAQPAFVGGQPCVPEASIGLAWTDCPLGIDVLVARADSEMYKAKRTRARAHTIGVDDVTSGR